jgi:hypothetical protein
MASGVCGWPWESQVVSRGRRWSLVVTGCLEGRMWPHKVADGFGGVDVVFLTGGISPCQEKLKGLAVEGTGRERDPQVGTQHK